MKNSQKIYFLLLFFFLFLSNSVESYDCSEAFEDNLRSKCSSLSKSSNERCIYSEGKCREKYNDCSSYKGADSTICESIPASDVSRECRIIDGQCIEELRLCNDFSEGKRIPPVSCNNFYVSSYYKKCVPLGLYCKEQYETCENYNSYVNINKRNKTECESISVFNYNGELSTDTVCSFSEETSLCSERRKECSELTSEEICNSFSLSKYDKKCSYIISEKKCQETYKDCETYENEATSKNEKECELIVLEDTSKKCVFKEGICTTKQKDCSEITDEDSCNAHIPEDSDKKKCIYLNGQCQEQYKTCEKYNEESDKTKEECEKIMPYFENGKNLDVDSFCSFEEEQCLRKSKNCEEYTNSKDCNNHQPENKNKRCVFENNECKEVYGSCANYNKEKDKNQNICENLINYSSKGIIDYSKKCIYDENGDCLEEIKTCSDYKKGQDEAFCTNITINSYTNCILDNGNCVQKYNDCPGEYTSDLNLDEPTCKSINPTDKYYKCILDEDKNCVRDKKVCSDYTENSNTDCEKYVTSDDSTKRCVLKNNQCIEQYADCDTYNSKADTIEKTICESIIPTKKNNKCKFIEGEPNTCKTLLKECDEYTKEECGYFYPEDEDKRCILKDEKCIEFFANCKSYNNSGLEIEKSVCESIKLIRGGDYDDILKSKCVFKEGNPNRCEKENIVCEDATTNLQCTNYGVPSDTKNKKCIFIDSQCYETYKSCSAYSSTGSVEKSVCESIILGNSNLKCVFKEGNPNTCVQEYKSCDDFNNEDHENLCTSIIPSKILKKCVYANSGCYEVDLNITCLDLKYSYDVSEIICSVTPASSSNKKCQIKADKSGCEEVDNSNNNGDNNSNNNGENSNNNGDNNSNNNGENSNNGNNENIGIWLKINMCLVYYLLALFA